MKILTMPQGQQEWWDARKGIPTASAFDKFTTPTGALSSAKSGDGLSQGATTYASTLIAESLGWVKDDFKGSPDIERGHQLESMARNYLAFEIGEEIPEVGFCLSDCGRYGGSPDGLIDGRIPIELKCPDLHTQVRYHLDGGGLPAAYKAQVHGQMIVTGAPYAWFCAYVADARVPNILLKVERDEYTEKLKRSVEQFCDRLDELKRQIIAA